MRQEANNNNKDPLIPHIKTIEKLFKRQLRANDQITVKIQIPPRELGLNALFGTLEISEIRFGDDKIIYF